MKIKRFKLNVLSSESLRQKEMNAIVGGNICGCGCLYAGQPGGSTTAANKNANFSNGYFSDENYYICDDNGNWEYQNPPIPRDTDY